MSDQDAPKKRGRPPKQTPTTEPTPPTPPANGTMYALRDKLSGQFVDWNNRLNPLSHVRLWETSDEAEQYRMMGIFPDAEEVIAISIKVEEAV